MASDYYAILGVTPGAEDVVIRAAYRALMRFYHPDTNRDPEAQVRAQAITMAYAVLRDPAKRAEYDARRAGEGEFWSAAEMGLPDRPRPPAMRGVGIASAALALALVAAAWTLPRADPPAQRTSHPQTARPEPPGITPEPAAPVVQLEPESERLARLHKQAGILPWAPAHVPPSDKTLTDESVPAVRVPTSPRAGRVVSSEPVRVAVAAPRRTVAEARRSPAPVPSPAAPAAITPKAIPKPDRVAALDRMSAGFFGQSMVHATPAKKNLLVAARDRSAALRKACRSDSCVADSYVRQIRETSAIMESRSGRPK